MTLKELRHCAVDLLARREHSQAELATKLKAKNGDPDQIAVLLNELAAAGIQSDERFCENYVRYRMLAGFGPRRIMQELQQRKVAFEMITSQINCGDINWREVLRTVWQKKFAAYPQSPKEYAKQQRFLLQRGFIAEDIHQLLSQQHEEIK